MGRRPQDWHMIVEIYDALEERLSQSLYTVSKSGSKIYISGDGDEWEVIVKRKPIDD